MPDHPSDAERIPDSKQRPRLLYRIMLAVLVWGILLAVGAALFGPDPATGEVAYAPNIWRGVIVLACVGTFLGGWLVLVTRKRS